MAQVETVMEVMALEQLLFPASDSACCVHLSTFQILAAFHLNIQWSRACARPKVPSNGSEVSTHRMPFTSRW